MHFSIHQKKALHPFNVLIFVLSLYVIIVLLLEAFIRFTPETIQLLRDIDYGICFMFFIDFLVRYFSAPNKMHYMRWGWIDLISSIPVFSIFQAARVFRIVQLLRVLRAFRSIDMVAHYYFRNKVQGAFTSVGIIAVLMVIFCAIGILNVERDAPGSNIRTAEDALWWAYVTITTVGYGDKYPVTSEGRIIAVALITVGVGLFGTFTAFVASWFVEKREEEEEKKNEEKKIEEKKEEEKKEAARKKKGIEEHKSIH
jgi:voltage-gated potassium channel